MKAIWNDQLLAESEETIKVEGNHYFPAASIKKEFFLNSDTHSKCPWKGKASYYHIKVAGKLNKDAAWFYPEPSSMADKIKNHVAFWRGVEIEP